MDVAVAVARCFLLLLLKSIETDDLIVSLYDLLLTFVIACLNCMTSVIACAGLKFNNNKKKGKRCQAHAPW